MQLVQTFFVASIAGSVTSALAEVNEVGDVFRFLAVTLPPQSIYFMQLILIQTVIGMGTELLRTTALLQAFFRNHIGPRVTEREKSLPFIGLRPLCSPRFFLHAQLLAGTTLRFMVLFTFAVLSPFISYILCFSFMVLEVGFRHQFVYIYPSTLDSGGRLWMMFITIIMVCMVLAELILITFMGLAKARPQLYMLCPLVMITGLFVIYLRQQHFRVARYLSSVTCDEVDTRTNLKNCDDVVLDFLKDKYLQPVLKTMYETAEKHTSLKVIDAEPSS
jgi:calcium permeable stress-gated cation channel